jgi:hypothetical protein
MTVPKKKVVCYCQLLNKKILDILIGQAFYVGGSERSGQQILGPRKAKDNDKKVAKLFEAARAQGAVEADEEDDDDEHGPPSHKKKGKAFAGVGYTLGNIVLCSFFILTTSKKFSFKIYR